MDHLGGTSAQNPSQVTLHATLQRARLARADGSVNGTSSVTASITKPDPLAVSWDWSIHAPAPRTTVNPTFLSLDAAPQYTMPSLVAQPPMVYEWELDLATGPEAVTAFDGIIYPTPPPSDGSQAVVHAPQLGLETAAPRFDLEPLVAFPELSEFPFQAWESNVAQEPSYTGWPQHLAPLSSSMWQPPVAAPQFIAPVMPQVMWYDPTPTQAARAAPYMPIDIVPPPLAASDKVPISRVKRQRSPEPVKPKRKRRRATAGGAPAAASSSTVPRAGQSTTPANDASRKTIIIIDDEVDASGDQGPHGKD